MREVLFAVFSLVVVLHLVSLCLFVFDVLCFVFVCIWFVDSCCGVCLACWFSGLFFCAWRLVCLICGFYCLRFCFF